MVSKLRNATFEEIRALLRKYPHARKIAVENFLSTVSGCECDDYAILNLRSDARLYGWNHDTVHAIAEGIKLTSK